MSEKSTHPIELKEHQVAYLERMAGKHGLPDVSKALRILVEFAIREPAEEERIFTEIRCRGC